MRLLFHLFASLLCAVATTEFAMGFSLARRTCATTTSLKSTPNPSNLSSQEINGMAAAAAEQMKNLKPEDIDKMIEEFDNMGPLQRTALKAMNMDPDMMKKTMTMMRDNPAMIRNAQELMKTMTPDELLEQSRKAQEQLSKMTPKDLEAASKIMEQIPEEQLSAAVSAIKSDRSKAAVIDATMTVVADDDDREEKVMDTGPGSSADGEVIDAMYRVAEYMSDPFSKGGGVTFAGFFSLPIIQLLSGDRESDLSPSEARECWADGSLGASRVDRVGFERVWNEVQEYFEDDVMGEARKEAKKKAATKKKRGNAAAASTPPTPAATIGENLSAEELKNVNERVKNLSNDEVDSVLGMMEAMDPAQEARLKAMGVDPMIMQRTAKMMKENPQLREQAKKMMANMSPEDMLKASQEAQKVTFRHDVLFRCGPDRLQCLWRSCVLTISHFFLFLFFSKWLE
jgi:hypothetical protein